MVIVICCGLFLFINFFCLEWVQRKYPRAPETTFSSAHEAANKYGLDKRKHGVDFGAKATKMVKQPENTHHHNEENQDEDSQAYDVFELCVETKKTSVIFILAAHYFVQCVSLNIVHSMLLNMN